MDYKVLFPALMIAMCISFGLAIILRVPHLMFYMVSVAAWTGALYYFMKGKSNGS